MPGRIAIDFGTSNTLVAVWDAELGEGVPLHIPGYGRRITYSRAGEVGEQISVIPSLIHYANDKKRWVGAQVLQHGLYDSERTFRWMKRYITHRSPTKCRIDGRQIGPADAGRDFVTAVLRSALAELDAPEEEIAVAVPVEAFEHYENWLAEVAAAAGLSRFRLIDEPSAAALGYGASVRPGDAYLVFDFGGGTLDVAVVLMEESASEAGGRRCRVLGKAGADIGGATLDGWLYAELLRRSGRSEGDDVVRAMSRALLIECERAKETLSSQDHAEIQVCHADTGTELKTVFTQHDLEKMLEAHDAYRQITATIRRALAATRERGFAEDDLKAVLLVGGSSLIPSVQELVRRTFGRERVLLRRPLDAVARGAAAFVAGVDFYDHIQHDYAVRHVDPVRGDYEYRVIVPRGTAYPTEQPLACLTVKGSHDGQDQLGLALFELGERDRSAGEQPMELVFDPLGAARLRPVTAEEEDRRYYFWVNEHTPTFLRADPPARKGEPRFEVDFGIDANKRLVISVRDLISRQMILCNYPVIKLT